jgi:hypothetical protein
VLQEAASIAAGSVWSSAKAVTRCLNGRLLFWRAYRIFTRMLPQGLSVSARWNDPDQGFMLLTRTLFILLILMIEVS